MTQAARRAYILGSNGPPGKGRLSYAVSDAERLARTLSARRCNFVVSRPKKDASALEVWTSLYAAIEQCETADTFVCSFSGHGLLDRGELFLLWDSSDPRKLLQTALPANQLFGALDRCNASSKLLILDCCHAGGILSKGFKSSSVPIADITNIDQNYLLLLASERLELARELKTEKGGFLTAAVCRALEDSNLQADSDEDGQISVDDLILTLRKAAQDHNRHNPKARVPTPILFGKNKSPVLLTARPTWKPWHFMLSGIDMVLLPIKMRRAVIGEDEVVAVSKGPITNGQYKAFVEDIDSRESFHGEPRQAPHGAVFDRETSRWITGLMPWSDPLFLADDKPGSVSRMERQWPSAVG